MTRRRHTGPWRRRVVALALGAATVALAHPARAERVVTLAEVEAAALGESMRTRRDAARIEGSEARVREARAAYFPQLSLGVDASMAPGSELVSIPIDLDDPNSDRVRVRGAREISDARALEPFFRGGLDLRFAGTLWDFGRTTSAVEAAEAGVDATRASLEAERAALRRAVRAAYVGWFAAARLAAFAAQAHASARGRLERVAGLVEEGAAPAPERSAAATDEALARLEAGRAGEAAEAARRRLARIAAVRLPVDAVPDPGTAGGMGEPDDAAERARLEALERLRAAAEARADGFAREHRPVLTGAAGVGVSGQLPGVGFPSYRVALGLSVPLWDAGADAARAAAARAEALDLAAQADAARHALEARRLDRREATAAHADLVEVALEAVGHAEGHLAAVEEAWRLGSGGLEAVALAERRLRAARQALVAAQVDLASARLGLSDAD